MHQYFQRYFLFLAGLSNPIDMMYHVQPWMILILLPLSISFEGLPILFEQNEALIQFNWVNGTSILIGAFLAFFMELSEYLLLVYTSSLTLVIAGVFKEVVTLFIAIEYGGDSMNSINFVGLILCLSGIILHVAFKTKEVTKLGE